MYEREVFDVKYVSICKKLDSDFAYFEEYCFSERKTYSTDYDENNQQDATTFSFINLFNSALHVSGNKFAHLHEQFWLCIQLLVQCTASAPDRCHPNRGTGRQQCRCIVPKAVYTVKKCS